MTHVISLPNPPNRGALLQTYTLFTSQVRLANGKPQFHFPIVHSTSMTILTDLKPSLTNNGTIHVLTSTLLLGMQLITI
jgi:hypothetical protein